MFLLNLAAVLALSKKDLMMLLEAKCVEGE